MGRAVINNKHHQIESEVIYSKWFFPVMNLDSIFNIIYYLYRLSHLGFPCLLKTIEFWWAIRNRKTKIFAAAAAAAVVVVVANFVDLAIVPPNMLSIMENHFHWQKNQRPQTLYGSSSYVRSLFIVILLLCYSFFPLYY